MPSIPAPARPVSTSSKVALRLVSRRSTAPSAVMVRLASSVSATRKTCQPSGAKESSPARWATTSGVRQRTKATVPASARSSIRSNASPNSRPCSSVHSTSVLRRRRETRTQPFHGLGIVDAGQQPEIAQTALQNCAIPLQKFVGNRHARWSTVHVEPVTIPKSVNEFAE